MKINLSQLEANPFRKISKYPIDREKVKQLKTSIEETTFWDNILARPHPTKKGILQMAYGHHRWIALKELKVKTVDIPVRSLDDAAMIRIMASENLDTWRASPAVVNETVLTTKEFLDAELKKCETWDKFQKNHLIDLLDGSREEDYKRLRSKGVGQTTILKFLGGNWKQWMVQSALSTISMHKEKTVDRKAVETFDKLEQANRFKAAVKEAKIPVKSQLGLAKVLKREEVASANIPDRVKEFAVQKKISLPDPKPLPMLDDYVKETTKMMNHVTPRLKRIQGNLESIQDSHIKEGFVMYGESLRDILNDILRQMKGLTNGKQ